MPELTPVRSSLAPTIERAVGVVMLVPVIGIYAFALSKGTTPPGHPWSGITLTLLSVRAIFSPVSAMAGPGVLSGRNVGLVVTALSLVSAGFWAVSASMALR